MSMFVHIHLSGEACNVLIGLAHSQLQCQCHIDSSDDESILTSLTLASR